ncbi:MAG: rRNA pseudouridine synthase [Puniceicoccales bacterium]|jgi:pseudouridine synthase|nr:rRNA pseudouridine synthase [Puniceicoccales bacterium]
MRLQKFLALQAVNSRRKAEKLIIAGAVSVNGKIAQIGASVDPSEDAVTVDGNTISNVPAQQHVQPLVLMLNKPAGCVCSHGDAYNRETIFDLVPKEFCRKKLMFCGRLDRETEGMIILTDCGDFAQKLTHPSFGIKKHYEALLSRPLPLGIGRLMVNGIEDSGEFLKFDKIISIGRGNMKNFAFEVVLSQGKKNEIHRVFAHFGIFVQKLRRIRIGGLNLKGVSPGRCRKLSAQEVKKLLNLK